MVDSVPEFAGDVMKYESFERKSAGEADTYLDITNETKIAVLKAVCKGEAGKVLHEFDRSKEFKQIWLNLKVAFGRKYNQAIGCVH